MVRRACTAYAVLGLCLWPLPLLNVLQVESAALIAFGSYFVAGWTAVAAFTEDDRPFGAVLVWQEAALLVPLSLLLVAQFWAPNCTVWQGLLFFLLFPGATVVFSVALAYFLTGLSLRSPVCVHVVLGGAIALAGPVYDVGLHPQLYTYNHVFGGVLGPIYDRQLAVREGLFAFRGLTVLWAGGAMLAGRLLRGHGGGSWLLICLAAIGGVYGFSGTLGLNTPASTVRSTLGGHYQTPHFDLYYDPSHLDSAAVAALATDHEAHYAYLTGRLHGRNEEEAERIQSYLYPSPDVKADLTGARTTSVAPVWLNQPQVHLLQNQAQSSLGHELAHVIGRSYGLPFLGASWAPGLVEGWAVALESPDPSPSSHDLVQVAHVADTVETLAGDADAVVRRLSPWGFWTGRGAVSYATMGSFVRYLLDMYGPERLKRVYAWANFEAVYGRSLRALAEEWAAFIQNQAVVSRAAHEVVSGQFTQPSLFEVECPHYVPPAQRHHQAAQQALRDRDTSSARETLRRALRVAPQFEPAHALLAQIRLAEGKATAVRRQLDTLRTERRTARVRRLQGDAYALDGRADTARVLYSEALQRTPRHAHDWRVRLMLRDAVARRPGTIRILTSSDSAHVQARRLANLHGRREAGSGVRAWRAIRLSDAHRYESAVSVWIQSFDPIREGRPPAWHQSWAVQKRTWGAEAASRAGRTAEAKRLAHEGARQAEALGAHEWARAVRQWGVRSTLDAPGARSSFSSLRRAAEPVRTCSVHESRRSFHASPF